MKKITTFTALILFVILTLPVNAQQPDRSKPPVLPAPPQLHLPEIEQFELSNGLKVYFMEKTQVPLIQLDLVVKTGTVNDPADKSGLANFTMDMMDEGAAGMSSLQLADAIDYLGANISTGSDFHFCGVNLHTPVSKFDEALKLYADIILHPDFPQNEMDRLRKERLTRLMQWHDQPTAIASIAFNQLLFGKDYPYGKSTLGSEASLNSMKTDDLKKFYSEYFKAGNAFIVAVGDMKKDELQKKLEDAFGKWEKGNVTPEKMKNAAQVKDRTVYIVDKPGSAQSVIYVGRVGVPRNTEDYYALTVMNTILGGSFTSRLNQNLREEHGYTYGAGSRFLYRVNAGPFYATSSVQTEVTDKALAEFFKELNGILEPVPDAELSRAKNYVALGYPADFQTVESIAGKIEEMKQYNLPSDYFGTFVSNILDVKQSDVNKAAKKYIVPEKMLVIIVGDRSKIEEGIKALKLGTIKNFSVEDILGKVPKL